MLLYSLWISWVKFYCRLARTWKGLLVDRSRKNGEAVWVPQAIGGWFTKYVRKYVQSWNYMTGQPMKWSWVGCLEWLKSEREEELLLSGVQAKPEEVLQLVDGVISNFLKLSWMSKCPYLSPCGLICKKSNEWRSFRLGTPGGSLPRSGLYPHFCCFQLAGRWPFSSSPSTIGITALSVAVCTLTLTKQTSS